MIPHPTSSRDKRHGRPMTTSGHRTPAPTGYTPTGGGHDGMRSHLGRRTQPRHRAVQQLRSDPHKELLIDPAGRRRVAVHTVRTALPAGVVDHAHRLTPGTHQPIRPRGLMPPLVVPTTANPRRPNTSRIHGGAHGDTVDGRHRGGKRVSGTRVNVQGRRRPRTRRGQRSHPPPGATPDRSPDRRTPAPTPHTEGTDPPTEPTT